MVIYSGANRPRAPDMHKAPVFGLVGLTAFGVAYDAGLLGTPDGHDHSAVVSVATAVSTGLANTVIVFNNVTGEDVAVVPPDLGLVGTLKP